jgi:hypothetical protein
LNDCFFFRQAFSFAPAAACSRAFRDANDAPRAVREYLDTLDDEAFGAATTAKPKFTAHADPASQWTAARKGPAFFAYSDNYPLMVPL